jgi:hypothetical protein
MSKHLLPLIPAELLVQQILPAPDGQMIVVISRDRTAACPDRGAPSREVQSRYERGRRCHNPHFRRQTFAERLYDSAPAAARRTHRLADLQRHLGLAQGGEAGGRLATRLDTPVSADTLIRIARRPDQLPEPALPPLVTGL